MRTDLPDGTVTFLFSDIEGSTRLLDELGEQEYAVALADHRRQLRESFAQHGGVEVDTQGDAFFVVFRIAQEAISAASVAQEVTAKSSLKVRIGLHTGTPLLTTDGYVGMDVHRAARIAAVAHGGQTVLSSATAESSRSPGLTDLGEHRLKDLTAPVRLYQIGSAKFRPLRSLYRTNIPIPAHGLVGRTADMQRIQSLIRTQGVRLLTLTGPGGTGKTKLAVHAAGELADVFPDGVWWTPLAAISDPGLMLQAVGTALSAEGDVVERIGNSRTLVVLDNFEHLIDSATDVAELLRRCPNLVVLVTSRAALRIAGEYEHPVEPLVLADAIDLFQARATAIQPAFDVDDTVAAICRRLDNLPLAIELAAARTRSLSTKALLERLEHALPLLAGGSRDAPERQQTLRATISWSYDLLEVDEKLVFSGLAVFRAGWTLEAGEAVAGASLDVLQSLVDKSLVRARDDRYSMLETIREFAAERLNEFGTANEVNATHAAFYLELVESAEPHIRFDSIEWVARLDADHDNIRSAFDHFMATGNYQGATQISGCASRFWYLRSFFREAQTRLTAALAADRTPNIARVRALNGAAVMAISLGSDQSGKEHADEALALATQLGDRWAQAYALLLLANVEMNWDRPAAARPYLDRATEIFRRVGDEHYLLIVNRNYALVAGKLGDVETQRRLHTENLEMARIRGAVRVEANSLSDLGMLVGVVDGDLETAFEMLQRAVRLDYERRDEGELAETLGRLASLLVRAGQPRRASRLLGASERLLESMAVQEILWWHEMNAYIRATATQAIGEAEFQREHGIGSSMELEDSVELALGPRVD